MKCIAYRTKAFTLAEVLITLGIIGIVAAITIPTLVKNYEKKVAVTKLKKVYIILNEAVKLSEIENGEVASWDYNTTGDVFFETYLAKHVKYLKKEFNTHQYKYLNGDTAQDFLKSGNAYAFILADGVNILIQSHYMTPNYKVIAVDINGYHKPNQCGKDVFLFVIGNPHSGQYGKVLPYRYTIDRDVLLNDIQRDYCNVNSPVSGFACATVIMKDNWQIKEDYPW